MERFEDVQKLVIEWAQARKIIPNATPTSQLLKAVSEMGELADADLKNQIPEIQDAIGDILVCLTCYCATRGIDMTECYALAYEEIKDRTGTLLPNGTFVKDTKC
jgi:NTP pyrophosphatase (non-canonical NTP hydrolase)